jgi:hypothetical protein
MRRFRACHSYAHLVEALGPDFGDKAPINLLTILELNGAEDCLWAMRATDQDSDAVAHLMAADFAEAVSPIFGRYPKSEQPKTLLDVARAFALGEIDAAAREAARTAQTKIIEKYLTK